MCLSELHEDSGFCQLVPDLVENGLRLPVVTEGITDTAMAMAGFSEPLDGEGMLPLIAGLFEESRCLSGQIDGCLKGSEVLVNSTQPDQGHALGPGVRGLAGGHHRLPETVQGFAEPFKGQTGYPL